jgi:hypothetical protein
MRALPAGSLRMAIIENTLYKNGDHAGAYRQPAGCRGSRQNPSEISI